MGNEKNLFIYKNQQIGVSGVLVSKKTYQKRIKMAKNKEFIFPSTIIELATTNFSIKRFIYRFAFGEEQSRKKKTSPKPIKMSLQDALELLLDHSHIPQTPSLAGKTVKLQAAQLLVSEFQQFLKKIKTKEKN